MSSDKHMKFVIEYMRTGDVVESYLVAYPTASRSSAYSAGRRILASNEAKAFMSTYMLNAAEDTGLLLSQRRYLDELIMIALDRRHKDQLSALKEIIKLSGLDEGMDRFTSIQRKKLDDSIKAFRCEFDLYKTPYSAITVNNIEEYISMFGVEYDESLSKREKYKILEKAVADHRKSDEYREHIESQANKANLGKQGDQGPALGDSGEPSY